METYKLYNGDKLLGKISYDSLLDKYNFEKSSKAISGFPGYFAKEPFLFSPKENINSDMVKSFVGSRVPSINNPIIGNFLEELDLSEYNVWEIFIRTGGMLMTDNFWIDSYETFRFKQHIRFNNDYPYIEYKQSNLDIRNDLENELRDLELIIRSAKAKQETTRMGITPLYINENRDSEVNSHTRIVLEVGYQSTNITVVEREVRVDCLGRKITTCRQTVHLEKSIL